MEPATRKASARKAMRVATVFTGAAAAAFAAPAAMAGTGHAAGAGNKTVTHRPMDHIAATRVLNNSGRQSGSIQRRPGFSACEGTPHWVHLIGSGVSGSAEACFGFKGLYDVSGGFRNPWGLNYECGANNHGFLNPKTSAQSFNVGTTYRKEFNLHMNSIRINGWNGNDTCPVSR